MKKFLTTVMLIGVIFSSFTIALAENKPTITKEEAIEILCEERISVPYGREDDGTTFPDISFEKHQIEKWVNENYGNDDICWYYEDEKMLKYSLNKKYGNYYKYMTTDWDFEDDRNGNWTIKTPDNFYTFEFVNGMWNQIDKDGNVVDMFPPVSTLDEDSTTATQADSVNGNAGNRVTGTVPTETQTTTVAETNENNDESSFPTGYLVIGGAAVGVAIGAGAFFLFKSKKG